MDTGYLAQQVTTIIGKLHSLFDEIGVPSHERDSRESDLFSSLSETLHNHLRIVAGEKNDLVEECQRVITVVQQMEESLDDVKGNAQYAPRHDELKVTYPLNDCLQTLKEKHRTIGKLHQERYEQVRKLIEALESYSSHLEPSFLHIQLPPVAADGTIPPTFDLSPSYISSVDDEFTRVYEEYNKRTALVQQMAQEVINLWAELGTPQAQTDALVVKHWRDSPEQLGLHTDDVKALQTRRDKLSDEKRGREKRINGLRSEIEVLWDRLSVQNQDRRAFLAGSRGCGLRTINDLEDELSRLHELKRQNLGLFVEDARTRLQRLWDDLYFSEEEAVEFTPMFCDVYSDALLSAHEAEISRLEALQEQRAPTLQMIEKHRSLIKDREDLAASSQDASRLLTKGNKGEKRDPTRLLREEKMRKRIAKDLPKVEAELMRVLCAWEEEYGRPFLVFGERYVDTMEASAARVPPPRSKTPNPGAGPKQSKAPVSAQPSRAPSQQPHPPPLRSKTPIPTSTIRGHPTSSSKPGLMKSPSKIPARIPLGSHNGNSPERRPQPPSMNKDNENNTDRKFGMAPPPKMRDIYNPPEMSTPASSGEQEVPRSGSVIRQRRPEDPYADHNKSDRMYMTSSMSQYSHVPSSIRGGSSTPQPYTSHQSNFGHHTNDHHPMAPPPRPPYRHPDHYANNDTASVASTAPSTASIYSSSSRQISATSSDGTAISGSENWESYEGSDDERAGYACEGNATDAYYADLRAARARANAGGKRGVEEMELGRPGGRNGKMMRVEGAREASWTTDEG